MVEGDDLPTVIEAAASEPKSATVDGRQVVGRDVSEVIEADKYLAARNATRRGFPGVVFGKITPPAAG